jgi:xanthine dehydrogenase accessory factor
MNQIINEMVDLCDRGESFVLATVITRNGSAPRSAGAKMLVRADGSTAGTVGGGILEAQVERLAAEVMNHHRTTVRGFQFSGQDAATMDAICGGEVEVLVQWVDTNDSNVTAIIQYLQVAITSHRKAWLVTVLPTANTTSSWSLVHADSKITGSLPPGLSLEMILQIRHPDLVEFEGQQAMVEPINIIAGTAFIFGAGHVSHSLAEFTEAVGFWTVVLDDRSEYANRLRFPKADEVIVLDSFSNALGKIEIDCDSFIVIVTRGHQNDLTVLAQVLKTKAGYIGMIGSRRKCEMIFKELCLSGYSEGDIMRVHAPIGLPIEAETPEEIGISIAAEMIQARAKLSK